MQTHPSESDYDKVLKILSFMDYARPIALVTICQKSGIKMADILRYSSRLEADKVIEKGMDNGNIFYTLRMRDYQPVIESMFSAPAEPAAAPRQPVDSREAILRRRSMRNAAAAEAQNVEIQPEIPAKTVRPVPEPISAVDLLKIRRSSAVNPRVYESGMVSSTRFTRISGSSQTNPMVDRRSSATHKAVFMNRSTVRGSVSRSTFTATPPSGFDASAMERSDTNFKPRTNYTSVPLQSLIPSSAVAQASNEVTATELLEKLQITADTPLLTVLSSRPSFDVWSACSAIVNAGGGILVLGMRQYGTGSDATFFIKSIARPEEAITNLYKSFNDRNIISDCPKDTSFMSIVEFGRKKVLAMRLTPDLFAKAPLYLTRDSFGMRTNQGCYIYRNGKAERCTPDEIEALWTRIRLGAEIPDWHQEGEVLPVEMTRNVKINLPSMIDDAVRPLSRKVCTYGQPLPQNDYRIAHPSLHHSYNASPIPETSQRPVPTPIQPSQPIAATPFPNAHETLENIAQAAPVAKSVPPTSPNIASAQDRDTLQLLLFAEDIRINKQDSEETSSQQTAESTGRTRSARGRRTASDSQLAFTGADNAVQKPESLLDLEPNPAIIPPTFAEADQNLLASIAAPAVEHLRLPTARLCEIAGNLLTAARLTPQELANLLQRKLPVIRTKVLASFSNNPNFKLTGNTYYIEK